MLVLLKDLKQLRDEILFGESQYVDVEIAPLAGDLTVTVKPKINLPIYNIRPETFTIKIYGFTNEMPEVDSGYLKTLVEDARKAVHRIGGRTRLLLANLNMLTEIDLSELVSKIREALSEEEGDEHD